MSDPYSPFAGLWWRFSSYEISRGYLRPAMDAKCEQYDPWEIFNQARESSQYGGQPYASLLKLIENIKFREDDDQKPTDKSVGEILEWCCNFGLLGLLPHQLETAVMAPRWAIIKEDSGQIIPEVRVFYRDPLGFRVDRMKAPILSHNSNGEVGELVSPKLLERCPKPHSIMRHLGGSRLISEPLTNTWARYFPDVPKDEAETYPYPTIMKEEFWRMYGEPIVDFLRAAFMLHDAVVCLSDWKQGRHSDEIEVWDGVETLNELVAGTRRAMLPTGHDGLPSRWISPSLLASFAAMAQSDLDENRRILRCERCSGLFVTSAHQARYCSVRCRQTQQKRNQRARQKSERIRDA